MLTLVKTLHSFIINPLSHITFFLKILTFIYCIFCTFGLHKCFFWLWKSICLLWQVLFSFLIYDDLSGMVINFSMVWISNPFLIC